MRYFVKQRGFSEHSKMQRFIGAFFAVRLSNKRHYAVLHDESKEGKAAAAVELVDTLAIGRLFNFFKRYGIKPSDTGSQKEETALVSRFDEDGMTEAGDVTTSFKLSKVRIHEFEHYKAVIQISLPDTVVKYDLTGVGYSENDREACHVAAMHLERCLDALGIQVHALKKTQEKYARGKRLRGLEAPMPGDKIKDPRIVRFPTALRLVRHEKIKAFLQYCPIRYKNFYGNRFALMSPVNLDEQCVDRVTSYCERASGGTKFENLLKSEEVGYSADKNKVKGMVNEDSNDQECIEYFIRSWSKVTLELPLPVKFGKRQAVGLGENSKQATIIACMHAELMLDTLGVPIFETAAEQEKHALTCEMFGRGAPRTGDELASPETPSPAPLRMTFPTEIASPSDPFFIDKYLEKFAGAECEEYSAIEEASVIDPMALKNLKAELTDGKQIILKTYGDGEAKVRVFKAIVFLQDQKIGPAIGVSTHPLKAKQLAAMQGMKLLEQSRASLASDESDEKANKPCAYPLRSLVGMEYVPNFLQVLSAEIEACESVREQYEQKLREFRLRNSNVAIPKARLLEEDDEGAILIPPEESARTSSSDFHTLISPRKFDNFALSRIDDYLHRRGLELENVLRVVPINDASGEEYYRAEVSLCVPAEFGDRKGIGEAPSIEEARILACMHAELVLDYLGIPLFDHFSLQLKHAQSARKYKRWAPLPQDPVCPPSTVSPPILRKFRKDSMCWLRFLRKKYGNQRVDISASHVKSGPTVRWDYVASHDLDYEAKFKLFHHIVTNPKNRKITSIDNRFQVSQIGESGINYFHCTVNVDVPAHRGSVVEAKGSAPIRGDAEMLCCMHALRTLDAMGLRIYFLNTMQNRHVENVRAQGRWARYTNEPAPPVSQSIEIPLPLRIDAAGPRPTSPALPTPPFSDEEWEEYISQVDVFLTRLNKWEFSKSVFQNSIPPVGDRLIDDAHQAIDVLETDMNSRTKLNNYCQVKGYELPSADVSSIGSKDHQRFYCELYVPGHMGLKAHGIGNSKDDALRRAAMHCLEIIFRIDPSARTLNLNYCNRQTSMFADRNLQAMHEEAKHRILELYCIIRDLQLPAFETIPSGHRSGRTYAVQVQLAEFQAKAEGPQHQLVLTQSLGFLINKLMKFDPLFREITKFLSDQPLLDVNTIFSLSLPSELLGRIHAFTTRVEKDCQQRIRIAKNRLHVPQRNRMEHNSIDTRWKRSKLWMEEQSKYLFEQQQAKLSDPKYLELYEKRRSTLPITNIREDLIRILYDENKQVVVLCGTTGCGKTTQVPQYLLDYEIEIGRGGACNILVTQPRRIGATSISKRIAEERLEELGDNVGYIIRLESHPGKHISCVTSGVLLRVLKTNPTLEGITHIIVDEIHERDINSDFLLILLRELIKKRKDLKIILMSATLQASTFADYFGGAAILEAEGGVFPVEMNFIEDVGKIAKDLNFYSPTLQAFGNDENIFELDLDYQLFAFLISYLIRTRSAEVIGGSILVFLPGWEEITQVQKILLSGSGGDPDKFQLIVLHSSVSPKEQALCFQKAQENKVKIILSTNIAESSVTIDDIRVVIDSGRMKEKSFVQTATKTHSGSETGEMGSYAQLITVPASRANCVQRTGRAGRTRGGICYRLYSKTHFEGLPAYQTPELLRQPLDSLCLAILSLGLGEPGDILGKAIECPSSDSLEYALARLEQIGAIMRSSAYGTHLTPLGEKLANLPLAPNIGKMIVYGSIFRCLDSILTIAASTETAMFVSNKEKRDSVHQIKQQFVRDSESDHIVKVNAYNAWVARSMESIEKDETDALMEFEKTYELKHAGFLQVSQYKKQFSEIVFEQILQSTPPETAIHNSPKCFVENSKLSDNSNNVTLVKSILCSGLYPNIAVHKEKKKTFRGKNDDLLVIQGNSVLVRSKNFGGPLCSPYVIFEEKQRIENSKGRRMVSFKDVSAVSPMSLLMFGPPPESLTYKDQIKLGLMDGWIPFRFDTSQDVLPILLKFKEIMTFVINEKLKVPRDGEINELLVEIRLFLNEILSYSTHANSLVDSEWSEKGTILSPMDKQAFVPVEIEPEKPESERDNETATDKAKKMKLFSNSIVHNEDGSSHHIEEMVGKNVKHLDTAEEAPYSPYKTIEAEEKAKGDLTEFISRHWTHKGNFGTLARYETEVSPRYHWKGRSVFTSMLHLNLATSVSFEGQLRGNRSDAERSVALIALRELKENVRLYFGTDKIKPAVRKSRRVFSIPEIDSSRSVRAALVEILYKRYPKTQDIEEVLYHRHSEADGLHFCDCVFMGVKHKARKGYTSRAAAEHAGNMNAYDAVKRNPQKYLGKGFINAAEVGKVFDEDGFEIDDDYKMYQKDSEAPEEESQNSTA
ncbi:RNA editing associated helicase [Perkinsela sp. CCAP 1560/4]|nr:RNA editing associated helicase [Perkinsela sp. CCAP 1560/4]|eukprot:KNH05879.1 RNA editing associated helicase [Perkinsela sp. CCAP 1560/4]